MDEQALRAFFLERGPAWISGQEARFRAGGRSLPDEVQRQMVPFFGSIPSGVTVSSTPITNPPWYDELRALGADERDLLDFAAIRGGITFNTAINIIPGVAETPALIFHELVHVVQYRLLGIDGFARRYVDGWFAARILVDNPEMRYRYIALERLAYDLEFTFARAPAIPFSVEEVVRGVMPRSSPSS